MAKKEYQLTEEGKKKLEEELSYLKNDARKANVEAIADARSQGDLSENADYAAAREEQGRIEARIKEIEEILKNCKIISTKGAGHDEVSIGKRVGLLLNGKACTFDIVSTIEVDPKNGKISDESPLGSNLKGKKVGDKVSFVTGNGKTVEAEITSIELM